MNTPATFADFLHVHQLNSTQIANLCVDLVSSWAGGMTADELYSQLISNAKDMGSVDLMLFQLEGDPEYAENVALLILSSAWNYPELAAAMNEFVESGEADTAGSHLDRHLALADLYGMYLLARNNAQVREVAYRDSTGEIKSHIVDHEFPAAKLFDAVREQYSALM